MARLIWTALEQGGFKPELATRLRMRDATARPGQIARLACAARAEADRYIAQARNRTAQSKPCAVVAYHVHYKAPDVAGPAIARALDIPYLAIEASRAPSRAFGRFHAHHRLCEDAIGQCAVVFAMTARDRAMLEQLAPTGQKIVDLPPFLDIRDWPEGPRNSGATPRLIAVAMMRDGDKLQSYQLLAEALAVLAARDWTLDLVGDGPARGKVERLFEDFGPKVRFSGEIDAQALSLRLTQADLLVWPAVNEAYGMALLEAQAMGVPVLAGDEGGVSDALVAGVTGELVPKRDAHAFAVRLAHLLDDRDRLRAMGQAASHFIRTERTLDRATAILQRELVALVGTRA